ncbi:peroxide stress protein YaaA [Algoriphagus sanaruensis]|uniref:Peroxide stress protein YaaA n=1 Tax=Algoriphagus sanaruensis TaxID=1727163 RepID=A0A142ERL5_9BACT|nr:peroxide stress protein YaaA [Algoriphagus sanaruensis]AMQ57770.1 hypothetical protein AO498_15050 [Algoriphagus sanaruensis]
MAYLITCAGSKVNPDKKNISSIESLSFSEKLDDSRKKLIELLGDKVSMDWDYTLPAWKLYSGNRSKLYPRVDEGCWEKDGINVLILSAMFGWIRHDDLIPFYDLRMTDTLNNGLPIWKFWFYEDVLIKIIEKTDVDLLSGSYRKAIIGRNQPVGILPNMRFTDYGVQKGMWLNQELTKY